jgi:hypothetical protein
MQNILSQLLATVLDPIRRLTRKLSAWAWEDEQVLHESGAFEQACLALEEAISEKDWFIEGSTKTMLDLVELSKAFREANPGQWAEFMRNHRMTPFDKVYMEAVLRDRRMPNSARHATP